VSFRHPVHPTDILATIYHTPGISPDTIIYNHLNQPRELVKAKSSPAYSHPVKRRSQ